MSKTAICLMMGLWCAGICAAQGRPPDEAYIESVFRTRIGEVPKMGWFDPERGFLAAESTGQVVLYGPLGTVSGAKKVRELSGSEIREVQHYRIACEVPPTGRLTAFEVGQAGDANRALYTTKKFPGDSRSGLTSVNTPDMEAVNRVLGWPENGALRRDEAIAVRAGSFSYSLHKLYSSTTGLLRQEAIILHGRNGQVIGFSVSRAASRYQHGGGPCIVTVHLYTQWEAY